MPVLFRKRSLNQFWPTPRRPTAENACLAGVGVPLLDRRRLKRVQSFRGERLLATAENKPEAFIRVQIRLKSVELGRPLRQIC